METRSRSRSSTAKGKRTPKPTMATSTNDLVTDGQGKIKVEPKVEAEEEAVTPQITAVWSLNDPISREEVVVVKEEVIPDDDTESITTPEEPPKKKAKLGRASEVKMVFKPRQTARKSTGKNAPTKQIASRGPPPPGFK